MGEGVARKAKRSFNDKTKREQHGATCLCKRCRAREVALLRQTSKFQTMEERRYLETVDEED